MSHPVYRGLVIDAHTHFDANAKRAADAVLDEPSLADHVVNFWNTRLPPPDFPAWHGTWRAYSSRGMSLLHMPDLSHIGEPGVEEEIAEGVAQAAGMGAVGIKVWKNLGLTERDADGRRVHIDDSRLDVLWSAAGAHGLPVAIHIADNRESFEPLTPANVRYEELRWRPDWWFGDRTRFPARELLFEEFERVVQRHRATVFIGLHFGCFMPIADVGRMLGAYPNYFIDTAARTFCLGQPPEREEAIALFHAAPDRIIFGTDLARTDEIDLPEPGAASRWDVSALYEHHWRFFETTEHVSPPYPFLPASQQLTGLGLDAKTLRMLYHDNAQRVFGLTDDSL